ncbi:P-loop containing nucleoside triphosphate hydrolase protein [Lentinus tigrinus ALCF2SS1-6]|uniref:P-loop containing nucleoside triphosphate hydrolase protein n=1 Tax=Lentinus tigrinus ALCF2SS1-6 TaxID=1328759 RepID=A0A5C2SG88_9APHY|nr:P-loop containing nucleoside triphosphate hydrolase protein [Lentinus tigrinus ALCF2SS1-6]
MASSTGSASSSSSVAPTPSPPTTVEELPSLELGIKYVDSKYDEEKNVWDYEDTSNPDVAAELVQPVGTDTSDENSDWSKFCFVVVRKYSRAQEKHKRTISFEVVIKSSYLRTACRDVMQQVRGISWVSEPLTLDPKLLITFYPNFEEYEQKLSSRSRTEEEERVLASLRVLLDWVRRNYRQTLARISSLVSHGEITFDLLYAILLPGTIIVRRCPTTRETRAMRLLKSVKLTNSCGQQYYGLDCEGLEEMVDEDEDADNSIGWSDEDLAARTGARFGYVESRATVHYFNGVEKICTLSAFPMQFHPDPEGLTAILLARARKWASLSGIHHMQCRGMAGRWEWMGNNQKLCKYSIKSRIMVDKASFNRVDADYDLPMPDHAIPNRVGAESLTDAELLLASPIVYGFSLSDKLWLEYNVNHITPIEWNDEAFAGLVLVPERKTLLRSLIEAHGRLSSNGENAFDDFIRGKGQGLVINLFGPPGVGKTLSAEATSEHLHRPLYIVGSGDLGTSAYELDQALGKAFSLAATWNAVLLIDEADVFLEQRSLHDMERNAMVAVFLRHVEYYRGILFLTTNRIKTFDEAFLSRIHVALHFSELSQPTKAQIWRAFLAKAGIAKEDVDDALVAKLAEREINGRQIKNACRTATSLALSRGERMRFEHLEEALNAMEEFLQEFATMQN